MITGRIRLAGDGSRISDEEVLAYMQRQLGSGRAKSAVLVELTQQAFPEVSRARIVHCFQQLDSPLLKR
ncbi:hypothetical protein ACIGKL_04850 [Pseudomonas sp. NPDC077186]|uniref:hypothetical protein n=1 Tax=Pseudomonas sp. NPDC077186 TaxID=3364421 RepID=UPI0037C59779